MRKRSSFIRHLIRHVSVPVFHAHPHPIGLFGRQLKFGREDSSCRLDIRKGLFPPLARRTISVDRRIPEPDFRHGIPIAIGGHRSGYRHPVRQRRQCQLLDASRFYAWIFEQNQRSIHQPGTQSVGIRFAGDILSHGPEAAQQNLPAAFGRKTGRIHTVIGHYQRRHTRNMGTCHRRSPQIGIAAVDIGAVNLFRVLRIGRTRPSGSEKVGRRAIIGVPGFLIIRAHGRHTDHLFHIARIAYMGVTAVTSRKADHTALHRSGLNPIFIRTGLPDKVLNGPLHRQRRLDTIVSPTALSDNGAVIGSINERLLRNAAHLLTVGIGIVVLTRHQPDTVTHTRTAGHTANTDTVVIDRSYRTCHMCTVEMLGYRSRIGIIIPSINVIHITVTVIVHAGCTVHLGLVCPHVGRQVGMVVLYAAVDNGHDNLRSPRPYLSPGFEQVDVCTRHRAFNRPVVVVMPLPGEFRVIEGSWFGPRLAFGKRPVQPVGNIRHHMCLGEPHAIHGLDDIDTRQRNHFGPGPGNGHFVGDSDIVP